MRPLPACQEGVLFVTCDCLPRAFYTLLFSLALSNPILVEVVTRFQINA